MLTFVVHRLASSIPVLLLVSLAVFAMLHLTPGDPAQLMLTAENVSPEQIERLREKLGLNAPLHEQYGRFLFNALRGNLGESIYSGRPVMESLLEQLPSTAELTLAAMILAVSLGVLLGILAALWHNSWLDSATMFFALLGVSMPGFWMGLLMILLFSVQLGWLPGTGQGSFDRLIMPAFVLGVHAAAIIARLVRSSMLEVMSQEYIVTARAKGLMDRLVIYRHALPNAMIPTVTMVGLQFGRMLAGAVIVETVFSRQGIGRLTVGAILSKDFPLVQGAVLFMAVIYLLVNLAVDISYGLIDPRIRRSEQ